MLKKADVELEQALSQILDKIDAAIMAGGYSGEPVSMYLAGGTAVNFYCGSRYTMDVDAVFSHRLLLPYADLVVDYLSSGGKQSLMYFDQNFNPDFALVHENYQDSAVEWEGIGNERRMVKLFVFSPVDLALSKLSRFSSDDRADIMSLAAEGLISVEGLRTRAEEAMAYYVGNTDFLRENLEFACEKIEGLSVLKKKAIERPTRSM